MLFSVCTRCRNTPLLCVVALLFLCFGAASVAAKKLPDVLVVHSYHPEFDWVAGYTAPLQWELHDSATLHHFYMDTKRLSPMLFSARADAAMAEVRRLRPDLVVTCDDNALKLVGQRVNDMGIPVVYLGVNGNPRFYLRDRNLSTGVLERPLLKRSVSFIRDILGPKADKCLVMFDDTTTSRVVQSIMLDKEREPLWVSGVQVDLLLTNSIDAWKEMILHARQSGYDFIIVGTAHAVHDSHNKRVLADSVYRWLAAHSQVPVFCFWEFAVGADKAIGGYVTDSGPQGRLAGELARRVLSGESPASIYPRTARQGAFVFSMSALVRWGLILPEQVADRARMVE